MARFEAEISVHPENGQRSCYSASGVCYSSECGWIRSERVFSMV